MRIAINESNKIMEAFSCHCFHGSTDVQVHSVEYLWTFNIGLGRNNGTVLFAFETRYAFLFMHSL